MCYYFSKTRSVSMAREHPSSPEKWDDAYEADRQERKDGEDRKPDSHLPASKQAA
jgi:hypothetical protein